MIITHLYISNYKQYGGTQEIEFPQLATIGVIGANGVGKTTLFEAIEWALYSPSGIKANDVRPRAYRGTTEVRVTLEDSANGTRYTVERELLKSSARARIYRDDEKIVDGPTEVTNYVTTNLIGLDHAAFVATFFTRQKELGFFGGSPTQRRRDVGKLLGLETIREAQQLIADDRKRALADARSYQAMSEAEQQGRDFAAEITAAEKRIGEASTALIDAGTRLEASKAATTTSEQALAAIEQVRDQDAALAQQSMRTQREHDLALQQSQHAGRDLNLLAQAAAERERLAPQATTVERLSSDDAQQTELRQKALRKRELQQALEALARRRSDAEGTARAAINTAPAPDGAREWSATNLETALTWARGIDLSEMERHANGIAGALESAGQLAIERQRLEAYVKRVTEIETLIASLGQSDPSAELERISDQLQQLQASSAAADSTRKRMHNDLQRDERILANLRSQHEGDTCPTCQRPFTAGDSAHLIGVFEANVQGFRVQMAEIDRQLHANSDTMKTLTTRRTELMEAVKKLADARASLESGNRYVSEQRTKVEELAARQASILESLDLSAPPSEQDRVATNTALTAWGRVVDAAAAVARSRDAISQIEREVQPISAELVTLQGLEYEESVHREITMRLQEARQAAAAIARIDSDLARKPDLEQQLQAAGKAVAEAQLALGALQKQRAHLGYDAAKLQASQQDVRVAREQERAEVELRHSAEANLRDAQHALTRIRTEQDRIGKLAREAESKQREADDLDLMYREFTEFERYAAAWYAPRLGEITSELVNQVTDGKYDKVEFDSNFSIQVYDGDDEKFPYEQFSGGERDAIALCARIALSRVIGGASSTPPGFLVLDEVFGSLDLERRQRLLEMLGAITGAGDHFRQVFLISHVDDVRTSQILDEIWQVSEDQSGVSQVTALGAGVDIGEL